eukprot:TRINITY_DN1788_c3_g4_i1.p1 TRINITY_DN1788_c3_g4~~TRINITY_DN1788_c3_g4_i1.p1  ORF type:complete len:518 (+),score=134.08 TRINITY_DN1788_c3_g4_i1:59-1555(+)
MPVAMARRPGPPLTAGRRHSAPAQGGGGSAAVSGLSKDAERVSLRAKLADAEARKRAAESQLQTVYAEMLMASVKDPEVILSIELTGANELLRVPVHPQTETVGHLKAKLEARTGIPGFQQVVVVGATELSEDSWLLESCGVSASAYMRVSKARPLRFTVRLNPFTAVRLCAYPDQRVAEIKSMLDKRANVPPRRQRLQLHGFDLDDVQTLRRCGVANGSELSLHRSDAPGRRKAAPAPPPPPHLHRTPDGPAARRTRRAELEDVVEAMAEGVTHLCNRQVELQKSVRGLVDTLDRVGASGAGARLGGKELLAQARDLRAEAEAETAAAIRAANRYRSPLAAPAAAVPSPSLPRALSADEGRYEQPTVRHELLRRLEQETGRYRDADDGIEALRGRLLSVERHRDEYFLLRRQMDRELDPMPQQPQKQERSEPKRPATAAPAAPPPVKEPAKSSGVQQQEPRETKPAAQPLSSPRRKGGSDSGDSFVPPDDPDIVLYS